MARGRPRRQHERTECVKGHPYVEGGFRVTTDGFRVCLTCDREFQRRYKEKLQVRPKEVPRTKKCPYCREYDALARQQNGVCAICNEHRTVLAVDHCHARGHVRGLLCRYCNTALGLLKDDPEVIKRAAEYVQAVREMDFRLSGGAT